MYLNGIKYLWLEKETNITVVDDKNIAVECDYKDVRATSES